MATTENGSVDFFVSYTGVDREWAEWIAWQIERKRFTCLVQSLDFGPAVDFIAEMRRAVSQARHTIAVLSPEYFNSKYASMELNAALHADPLGYERRLLPVRVRTCTLPDFMKTRVYVDFVGVEREVARDRLIAAVEAVRLRSGDKQSRFSKPPRFPSSLPPSDTAAILPQVAPRRPGATRFLFVGTETDSGLELRQQAKLLRSALQRAIAAKRAKFKAVFDVTPTTLLDTLVEFAPDCLHISGKQDGGELFLKGDDGAVTTVSDSALAGLIQMLDVPPRVVIVDTCFSSRCAQTLSGTVEAAIGVKSFIYDHEATAFYEGAYKALGSGRSIREALGYGQWSLRADRVPKARIPVLFSQRSSIPSKLILIPK